MKPDKKTIIKWLRECIDEGSGIPCQECPWVRHEACSWELMKDAAEALEEGGNL